jgi:hypothetical protein
MLSGWNCPLVLPASRNNITCTWARRVCFLPNTGQDKTKKYTTSQGASGKKNKKEQQVVRNGV